MKIGFPNTLMQINYELYVSDKLINCKKKKGQLPKSVAPILTTFVTPKIQIRERNADRKKF